MILEFDTKNKYLKLYWKGIVNEFPLSATYNTKIHDAFKDNLTYLNVANDDITKLNECAIYHSARNILYRNMLNSMLYMDILIYSTDNDIIYHNALNRSLGHKNDINELEIHQVLSGQVISLFISPLGEEYIGFFNKGDYFEIPPGWFHCTYVVSNPAVVANFYCNTYWQDRINDKPYFEIFNDICIEKSRKNNKFNLYRRNYLDCIEVSEDNLRAINLLNINTFEKIYDENILTKNYYSFSDNIFDLFYLLHMEE